MRLGVLLLVAFVGPATPKIPVFKYHAVVTGQLACPPPPPGTIDKTDVTVEASLEYTRFPGKHIEVIANVSEDGRRQFSMAGDYVAPSFHSVRLRVSGYRCGTQLIENLKPAYSERLPNDPEYRIIEVYSLGGIEMPGDRK